MGPEGLGTFLRCARLLPELERLLLDRLPPGSPKDPFWDLEATPRCDPQAPPYLFDPVAAWLPLLRSFPARVIPACGLHRVGTHGGPV